MPAITPASGASTTPFDPATISQPTTTAQNPGSILDRDAFLKLLVAQLKYQDPTNPTDASSMMAQTSQLTMVERLDDINKSLTAAAATDRLTLAGTMVGRQVTFQSESGPSTAVVDSIRFVNGEFVLSAGGFAVPMQAIIEVGSPPLSPTATAATTPSPAAAAPAAAPSSTPTPTPASPATPEATNDPSATTGTSGTVATPATTAATAANSASDPSETQLRRPPW